VKENNAERERVQFDRHAPKKGFISELAGKQRGWGLGGVANLYEPKSPTTDQ